MAGYFLMHERVPGRGCVSVLEFCSHAADQRWYTVSLRDWRGRLRESRVFECEGYFDLRNDGPVRDARELGREWLNRIRMQGGGE